MVSSRFGTKPGPRPTPQTCYPPPPPPPPPGYVACAGCDPTNMIRCTIKGSFFPTGPVPGPYPNDSSSNMCNVSWSYGRTTFTSIHTGANYSQLQVMLRCRTGGAMGGTWEGRIVGSIQMPDGSRATNGYGWTSGPQNQPPDPKYRLNVRWMAIGMTAWRTATWYATPIEVIWQNVAAVSRSRPPNPMIPAI